MCIRDRNRTIGVIANPASGKDIRRLVSYATTIDNNEKVNICKRIVLAAQGLGVESVVFMPETFMIGWAVREGLESDGVLRANVELLDFEIEAAQEDTTRAARMFEELGAVSYTHLSRSGRPSSAARTSPRSKRRPESASRARSQPVIAMKSPAKAASRMCPA